MTDIVERLRDPAFAHDRDGYLPLRLEAAAEIERLLGGIKRASDYLDQQRTGDASFVLEALLAGTAHEQKARQGGHNAIRE